MRLSFSIVLVACNRSESLENTTQYRQTRVAAVNNLLLYEGKAVRNRLWRLRCRCDRVGKCAGRAKID